VRGTPSNPDASVDALVRIRPERRPAGGVAAMTQKRQNVAPQQAFR
jgi:hypothetical protein